MSSLVTHSNTFDMPAKMEYRVTSLGVESPHIRMGRRRPNLIIKSETAASGPLVANIPSIAPLEDVKAAAQAPLVTFGPKVSNDPILTIELARKIALPATVNPENVLPEPTPLKEVAPLKEMKMGMDKQDSIYAAAKGIDLKRLNSTKIKGNETYSKDEMISILRKLDVSSVRGNKENLRDAIKNELRKLGLPTN